MIITCPNCTTRYSLPQDKIKPGGQKVRCAKCGTVWHQAPEDEPLALTPEDQVPPPPTPPDPAWAPATPAEPAPPIIPPTPAEPPPIAEPAPSEPPAAVEPPAVEPPAAQPAGFAQFHVPADQEETSGKGRKIAIGVIVLVVLALGALVAFKQQVQDLTGIQLVSSSPPAAAPPAATAAPAAPSRPKPPQVLTLTFDEVESSIEEIDGIKRLMVKGVIVNPADHEQVVPALAFNMLDKDGKAIDRWTFPAPVRALAPHTTTRFSSQRDTPPVALVELVPGFDVPENPPPVIEPPAGAAATPGAPPASAPAAGAPKPATPSAVNPVPARPPASQQTPAPIE